MENLKIVVMNAVVENLTKALSASESIEDKAQCIIDTGAYLVRTMNDGKKKEIHQSEYRLGRKTKMALIEELLLNNKDKVVSKEKILMLLENNKFHNKKANNMDLYRIRKQLKDKHKNLHFNNREFYWTKEE